MLSSDEIFMEHREQQLFEQEASQEQEYLHHQEEDGKILPVIDMGALQPSLATTEQLAMSIIRAVKSGFISPLELAVKKKCVSDALDMAMKDPEIKGIVVSEIEKYGKEGASCLGAKLTVVSRSTYEYKADPKWKALNDSIAPVLEEIKKQEDRIKAAVKSNSTLIDNETGEMLATVVPAPATETITVSFKKK